MLHECRDIVEYLYMYILMRSLVVIFIIFFSGVSLSGADICTYNTYRWNVLTKSAGNYKHVQKPYSELSEEEVDELTGCTVCLEDQVDVFIENVSPFKVCKNIATDIKTALEESIFFGQTITEVVGYRVGRTKGDVDQFGNRTQFSNHSFGTAIDINPQFNGLYTNCINYNSDCLLIKGGAWNPGHAESLKADAHVVRIMKSIGFKWGGEIEGKQKDFMHFSLSGY